LRREQCRELLPREATEETGILLGYEIARQPPLVGDEAVDALLEGRSGAAAQRLEDVG
jgi:hypothetical protein